MMPPSHFQWEEAYVIAAICLYSTGHWIGGTVAVIIAFLIIRKGS